MVSSAVPDMPVPACNAAMLSRAMPATPKAENSITMRTMTKITNTDTNVSRAFSSRRSRRESNEGRPPSSASLVRPFVLLIGVLSTYLKRR